MIVSAEGFASKSSSVTGGATKIVSTCGTAYVKKSVGRAVIRVIKTVYRKVVKTVKRVFMSIVVKLNTKSGAATSMAPPRVE